MQKSILNEDLFEDKPEDELLTNQIISQLMALIRNRFDAIDQMNGFKQYVIQSNINIDILDVMETIIEDENKHIGLLQGALKSISPESSEIIAGEQEAEQKLD